MKRKNKKQRQFEENQIKAFVFLGLALMYFICGQIVIASCEFFPTAKAHIFNSSPKSAQTENEDEEKTERITVGALTDQKNGTWEERNTFSDSDSQIIVNVESSKFEANDDVVCYFYFMGNEDFSKPILVGSDKKTANGTAHETLTFELQSTGNRWQLLGNFKAVISIPSENAREEIDFSIL